MHAHNRRIDHLHGCVMRGSQRAHNPTPDAGPSPANETIVASRIRPKTLRQIAPRRTRTQDPKDAVEHAAVIHTRRATRLVRQERLDGNPFIIGEFIAHDSRLRFGSLNHSPGDASTLPGPSCRMPMPSFTSAFGPQRAWRDVLLASSRSKMTRLGHRRGDSEIGISAEIAGSL